MIDWLPGCIKKITPNIYGPDHKPEKIEAVEAAIYHYTASWGTAGTLTWLLDPTSKASAHFLVARDGTKYQLAPLSSRTWHAGGDTSRLFGRENVNGRTIGIEVMNVGPLYQDGDSIYSVAEGKLFVGAGASGGGPPKYQYTMWEAYSPDAIKSVIEITQQLIQEFPVLAQDPTTRLIGHEDVDPTRKQDPGPLYPWDLIRAS